MEYGNRGIGSLVAAPQAAGGVTTYGTLPCGALAVHSPPGTSTNFEASHSAVSGAGPRPALKPFGPVQHNGGKSGNAGYCLASGLPARRRLLGRRQQQQAQKRQQQTRTTDNTTQGNAAGSTSVESSNGCNSSQRKRPTIKEFLGVNPADLIVPLFSSPQKGANKQMTKDAPQKETHGAGSSSGVSPLAFYSVRSPAQQEPQRQTPSLRQKTSSVLPSFLARFLSFGGDQATCAGDKASNSDEDDQKHRTRQRRDTEEQASTAGGAPASVGQQQATVTPPGIIVRPSAPLVPAFNASDGNQPVWKPIVYESEPIYLLPDGSVSNAGNNTQATTNATPLRNETQTVGTVPGCAVSTAPSCIVNAARAPKSESAPPAAGYGSTVVQEIQQDSCPVTAGAVRRTNDGLLLQTPTPLMASSLEGAQDSTEQTEVPLTNYQRYLRWKEQQRKQQLLYQQLQMEQQQQRITAQWMKAIESLLPQVQSRGSYKPSTHYANNVPSALPWGQSYQGQSFQVQQQQLLEVQQEQFKSQQQQQRPFDQQQEQQRRLDAQQQLSDSQQQPFDLQQQAFMSAHQASQQHLQTLSAQRQQQPWDQQQFNFTEAQQQQQYAERQRVQNALFRNSAPPWEQELEAAASTCGRHRQQPPVHHQQQYLHENQLGEKWQGLQQWEAAKNGLHQHSQDESCQGGALAALHQQLYVQNQTGGNGYLPQTSVAQCPTRTDLDGAVDRNYAPSPVPWMPGSNDLQNTSGLYNIDLEAAGQQILHEGGADHMPNFFPQPAYVPQPPPFSHAMKPVAGSPFHPGFNYAEGISVHYNYYDAEEWTSKVQAAATQRESSGSTEAGAEQEILRDASAASLSISSDIGEETAAPLGLKPLLTSKQRLPSGQAFAR